MDLTYIIFVLPAVIFSLIASVMVKSTFNKYSMDFSSRGFTGAQAARTVLLANGVTDVRIEPISGNLTDHFDPQAKVIRLSESVYNNTSTAAIGVACHEAGHAAQYASDYFPIKIRTAIIPITNIASRLAVPMIFIGLLLSALSVAFLWIGYLGIIFFAVSTLFQLLTLPVEFNASRRAVKCIEENLLLTKDEVKATKKVLKAAAMTYVAALAVSLMQLLRFVVLLGGNRRRN